MKEYKVESFIYYSKMTTNKTHILDDSTRDMQEKIDLMSVDGWRLVSTDATSFGTAMYFYLYFERGLSDS